MTVDLWGNDLVLLMADATDLLMAEQSVVYLVVWTVDSSAFWLAVLTVGNEVVLSLVRYGKNRSLHGDSFLYG